MTLLSEIATGQKGRIVSIENSPLQPNLRARLMEMGFLEHEIVVVINRAPWGRDPMAVRVRGTTVALRKLEASLIRLEVAELESTHEKAIDPRDIQNDR